MINPLTGRTIKMGSKTYKYLLYNLTVLPIDVLNEIVDKLHISQLINLILTCKHFNKLINNLWYYQYYIKNKKLIDCGNQFSMIIKNNQLYNLGCNYNKQLGLPNNIYHKPQLLMNQVCTISCGSNHALILTYNHLYGLGSNSHGQIAAPLTNNYDNVQFININNILSIHCGDYHSLVLTKEHLYSFGDNNCGQLGLGDFDECLKPTIIDFFNDKIHKICKIGCGFYHNIVMFKDCLYGFGNNYYHQLGLPCLYHHTPRLLTYEKDLDEEFIDVGCGRNHSIVITNKGIYGVGANHNGQLGHKTIDVTHQFIKINIDDAIKVECGQYHNIVLTKDYNLYMFGDNFYGQLGLSKEYHTHYIPRKLNLKLNIKSISCGYNHNIIYGYNSKNKQVYIVFGDNKYGELGLGQFKNKKYYRPQLLKL